MKLIFSIRNACIDLGLYNESIGMITRERWSESQKGKHSCGKRRGEVMEIRH